MDYIIPALLEAVLLTTALSMDALVSSFAYGTNRIRIPLRSVLVIAGICSGLLALSLAAGSLATQVLPGYAGNLASFAILAGLGMVKLFDSYLKSLIKRRSGLDKKIRFSMFSVSFILNIYASPEQADQDRSRCLSPVEAASLALALSLDSLAVGFGAGIGSVYYAVVIPLSFAVGIAAVMIGCRIGNKVAEKTSVNLSWLSGAMLLLLALMRL